jgi:hypothetical protein
VARRTSERSLHMQSNANSQSSYCSASTQTTQTQALLPLVLLLLLLLVLLPLRHHQMRSFVLSCWGWRGRQRKSSRSLVRSGCVSDTHSRTSMRTIA